jgi:peptidoglycan hydrolase-like protein with peptidoglycan-binding domain
LGQCRTNNEAGLNDAMGKYVSIGSRGQFVKTIQLKLANYSEQYAASMHAVKKNDYKIDPIDGIFGKVTSRLVKDYQSHEGISPADGRVRKNTWDALKNIRTANVYDVNTQKWEPVGGKVENLQGLKAKSLTPTDTNEPTLGSPQEPTLSASQKPIGSRVRNNWDEYEY